MAFINWTELELIDVIKLYCRLPFGQLHARNPEIIVLASQLGRTSNAVALKMANMVSLDPTIDRKGMDKVSKLDRDTWTKFMNNIDYYLETDGQNPSGFSDLPQAPYFVETERLGLNVKALGTQRRGQAFFREMILASYDRRCALSGIDEPSLLIASHIAPWAAASSRRLDPRNGICLNALFDRAFDQGLIAFSDELKILFAKNMKNETEKKLRDSGNASLRHPSKFLPDPDLLKAHRERFNQEYIL